MISTSTNPQLHIRQTNTGDYSRIRMQTGTNRFWDIAGFNHGTTLADERLNFFNSLQGDILSITGNGYVGIGTTNPAAPLGFPAALGKKITLYPGATGDVGFSVAGNRLQIYSDNVNADVAIGYDAFGSFVERFAFKSSGALAINSSTGNNGDVLTSSGTNVSPTWKSPTNSLYQNTYINVQSGSVDVTTSNAPQDLPGLARTVTVTGNAKLMIYLNVAAWAFSCPLCTYSEPFVDLIVNGAMTMTYRGGRLTYLESTTITGTHMIQVGPGTYTIKLSANVGPSSELTRFINGPLFSNMVIQVINE
jgi:hypothetical protein